MTVERSLLDLNLGDMLVAGCAVAYALHMVVLGRFAASASPGPLVVVQIATASALSAGTFWWAEPMRLTWSTNVLIALVVTSLLATLIFSMEPVFAWVTSYIVAGEVLSRRAIAGAVLILTGILLVELKPFRALTARN
jgi:drug/metabolite transporter (DMT)-like permease